MSVPDADPSPIEQAPAWLRRSARNFSALFVAEVVKVACGATATVYLARVLGVEGFGVYGFMLAALGYLTALVDGGFTLVGTRDVAADRSRVAEHVRIIVSLRLLLAAVALVALTLFTSSIDAPPVVKRVLLLTGLSAVTAALSLDWVFYGLEQASPVAAATIVRSGLLIGAIFLFVRRPDQVWIVPLVQAGSEAAGLLLLVWAYRARFGLPDLSAYARRAMARPRRSLGEGGRADWRACRALLVQALPIGSAQVLRSVNYWFGVTLIGLWLNEADVGQFVGAQKLMLFLLGFATTYFLTYLPLMAGALNRDVTQASHILSVSVRLTAALTLPIAIGGTVLAGPIVAMVYGPGYEASARPFQILIWVLPIVILAAHYRNALIAAKLQRLDLGCVLASAAVNVCTSVLLVPRMGVSGAAVAMTLSEAVLLGAAYVAVSRRLMRSSIAGHLVLPLAAGGVMAGLVWWIQPLGLGSAILIGASLYFALLWAAGGLRPAEVVGLFRA